MRRARTIEALYERVGGIERTVNKMMLELLTGNPKPLRPMFYAVADRTEGKVLVGAEIGTYRGENAKVILNHLPMEMLYLIDPYIRVGHPHRIPEAEGKARRRLKGRTNVTWVRRPAHEAVSLVPDNLDFVYIDGNHEYGAVRRDIQDWWPKVKDGGILGGHNVTLAGVAKAFFEFLQAHPGYRWHVRKLDWWVIKEANRAREMKAKANRH